MATQLMQPFHLSGQLDMVFFIKLFFGVSLEIRVLRDLVNTDLPVIISSYRNVKTGELAYEDICTEPQRHNS